MKNTAVDPDLDPRLLEFATQVRKRSDSKVSVEDGKIVVGEIPNCLILSVDPDDRILISFHFDCHPTTVVALLLIMLSVLDAQDVKLAHSFLSDVNGVLTYEQEPGFDLMHLQYLRDMVMSRQSKFFVA